ncbi:Vacuolar protein sorting-associated protein 8, partial [Actinomortierella ambigua]
VVDIDGEQAALLVHKYLNAEHQVVLRTLHGSKPRLFAYLRGLLEPSSLMERRAAAEEAARARRAKLAALEAHHGPLLHSLDRFEADIELDDELELYGPGDLGVEDDDDPLTMIGAQAITDPEMHEIYIELMCEYDPTSVYDYLERHQDNCYRLEKVLSICERAGVVDAVVWILERSGNVNGALTKVLEIVQDRIQAVADLVASKPKDRLQDAQWSMEEQNTIRASLVRLRGVLNVGKQLCERSSRRARGLRKHSTTIATTTTNSAAGTPTLSPPGSSPTNSGTARETETLWFRLLQTFVAASRKMTLLVEGDKDDDEDMEAAAEANHADEAPAADTDKTDSQAVVTARKEGAQKRVRGAKTAPSGPERSSGAAALSMIENAPQALFANTGVESQTSYNVVNQVVNSFKGYVHSILTTLLLSASTPQVSLPSLLRRLIQAQEDAATAASSAEDGHGDEASVARDARFADFREIILGMLDTYKYEGQLLEMTNNLFERDLLVGVRQIVKFHAKGWRPRKRNCEICGGAFWGPDVIRDLWVQQQRAAAAGIQAALATKVTSDSPDPSVSASASSYSTTASTGAIVVVPSESGESSLSNASPSPAQPSTVTPSSAQEMSAAEKLAGKDLILFRCGHGYHRQCLEMETRVVGGVNTVAAAVGRLSGTQPSKDPRGKTPIRNTDAQVSSTVGQQPSPLEQQPEEQALLCIMCSGLSKGPRVAPGGGSSSLKGHSSKRHSNSHQRRARRRDLHSEWEFIPHP